MEDKEDQLNEEKKYASFILKLGGFSFSQDTFTERFYAFKELLLGSPLGITDVSLMLFHRQGIKKGSLEDYLEPDRPTFRIGEGLAGLAAKDKKPLYVSDVTKNKNYIELSRKKRGVICYPMLTRKNEVRGVVNLTTKAEREFSKFERSIIKLIVARINSGIKNKLIYEDLKMERNEHRVLSIILQTLAGDDSFSQKITTVMASVKSYLKIKDAKLLVVETKENKRKIAIVAYDQTKKHSEAKCYHETDVVKRIIKEVFPRQEVTYFTQEKWKKINTCPKCGEKIIEKDISSNYIAIDPIYDDREPVGAIILGNDAPLLLNERPQLIYFLTILNKAIKLQLGIKKTAEKIIAEKDKWFHIYKNTTDGLVLINEEGIILEVNNAIEKIFGIKESKLLNKKIEKVINVIDSKNLFSMYLKSDNLMKTDAQKINNLNFISDIQSVFKGKNAKKTQHLVEVQGKRLWLEFSYKLIQEERDKPRSAFIHIRNVTNQKLFDQGKNEFISIVSHELRTPLAGMKGFLSMIINEDYGKITPIQRKFLKRVADSNQRMVDLVEDLLDASRIDMGRITLRKEPVELIEVVNNNIENLKAKTNEKNIEIKFDVKEKEFYALADKDRVAQIFQNIIDNAIKYSFPKSQVKIRMSEKRGYIETEVSDKGVGIPKEEEKYLFQKFYRIHNPLSIVAGGTGLGLYITKKLVDALDGDIIVNSRDKLGTTFTIKLPVAKQLSLMDY